MNTEQIAKACFTDNTTAARWLAVLGATFFQFGINDPLEQAAFLAQAGYESGGLLHLEENLNYSAQGLLTVFGKYFDNASALEYQHQPIRIANRVYAGRFGNGDESTGDGWKFRGRGIFQTTFHDNYLKVENRLGIACVDDPDLLLVKKNAADAAAVYWKDHNLGALAKRRDIDSITKAISGSMATAAKRKARYIVACQAFCI